MASTKATKAPAKAKLDDAAAIAERADNLASSAAAQLAVAFDESGAVFKRARIIATAHAKGASMQTLADETTRHRIIAAFPSLDALGVTEWVAALKAGKDATTEQALIVKRARKLKLVISKSSVTNYAAGWNRVKDAGVTPDADTVAAMFRLVSAGGTADAVKSAIAAALAASDPRAALLASIEESTMDVNAKQSSEGRPGGSVDTGADTVTGPTDELAEGAPSTIVPDAVGPFDRLIAALDSLDVEALSPREREQLIARLDDVQASLMGELVAA